MDAPLEERLAAVIGTPGEAGAPEEGKKMRFRLRMRSLRFPDGQKNHQQGNHGPACHPFAD